MLLYLSPRKSFLGSCVKATSTMLLFVLALCLIMNPTAANKVPTRMGSPSEGFQVTSNTECPPSAPITFSRLLRLDALGTASAVLDNGVGSEQFCATLRDVLNDAFGASCDDDEGMKFPKTIDALEIVQSSSNIIRSNVRGGQDYFSFLLNLNVTCDGSGCTEDSDLFIPTSGPDRCDQVSKSFRCRAQENGRDHSLMPCECPIQKEFHLLDVLNEAIKSGPLSEHMDSVMDMLELEIVPACEGLPEKTTFMTTIEIKVSHPGDSLPVEDMVFVNSAFKDLYNDMNTRDDDFCDPEARQIESIVLSQSEIQILDGPFNTTELWFRVSGTCYGCDTSDTHLFEYGNQEITRKLSEAALVDAECFCPRNVPLQAPSKADFVARFQDRVEILGDSSLIIAGTNEVQSFQCPTTSDQISVSTIVELKVTDKTAEEVTLESQDFSFFQNSFVESYNMATEEFCDSEFRRIDSALVTKVVPVSNDTVTVQIDLQGSCQGCTGRDIMFIFDTYSNPGKNLLSQNHRRYLEEDQCFCHLDAPNRAIAEEEFIPVLQQAVQADLDRGLIENVQPCYLETIFENAVLVSAQSSADLSDYGEILSESFKNAVNRNLGRDDICDPRFREVIDVKVQAGSFEGIKFTEAPSMSPTLNPTRSPSSMPSFLNSTLLNETLSPESELPSSAPSSSPTFEPTTEFQAFTQYIAFFFTGTCRGCQGEDFLANDVSDRRLSQRVRQAQQTGPSSSCYCPFDAVRFVETEETLLDALQDEIKSNSEVPDNTFLLELTEVSPVACDETKRFFESNLVKIDFSTDGALDIDPILALAASTYNEMVQGQYCDPYFRQIFETKLIRTSTPLEISETSAKNQIGCFNYSLEVSFMGECRGCSDGDPILETRTQSSNMRILEDGGVQSSHSRAAFRALQQESPGRCFCDLDAIAERAPTYDEFKERLEQNIRAYGSLSKTVCEVKSVSGKPLPPSAPVSAAPSFIPSDMPSTLPSSVPSTSMVPSSAPSNNPSASVYPSELPSSVPTGCIAESACNPQKACQRSENLCVGPDSCSGKNSCRATLNADIESNSCIGQSACQSLTGTVGDSSCQGVSACGLSTANQLIIGDGSCLGDQSCFQIKSSQDRNNRDKDTVIGDGSCGAPNACTNFQGVSIGSNSCNCEGCCACFATGELPDEIPPDSCNVRGECCSTDAPTEVPSSGPTATPSKTPTGMPSTLLPVFDIPLSECKTVGSTTNIVNCLSGPDILADPNSPQSQALQWILDSTEVNNWDGLELSQRYVAGLVWASSSDGLQSFGDQNTPICDTFDVDCNANNEIISWYIESYEGTLPREIGALTALQSLSSDCSYLEGRVPSEIGLLSQLTSILFEENSFSGPIPSEIGLLTQLSTINFDYSTFTGLIPSEIGLLTQLTMIELAYNSFTGPIPSEIGLLTQLTYAELNENALTGTIPPEVGQLTALTYLDLYYNELTGTIPAEIGQLTALWALYLYGNQLTGAMPTILGQLTALKYLGLSNNQLTGTLPSQLGQLTALTVLNFGTNQLTGTLPTQLGHLTPALKYLSLSNNQLTGPIPLALTQLTNLESLFLHNNNLTGQMPSGFCAAPFPDWRNSFGGGSLWADCMGTPEVQCDCCDRCYDESGNCLDWNGSGFSAC